VHVTLLGTGMLVPEAGRGSAAFLVEGAGRVLPVDLGRGALTGMVEAGVNPLEIDRFFLTHLHADHTSELVSLLFALRHGRTGQGAVELVGPSGLAALVERISEAWPSTTPDYRLSIRETDGGVVSEEGLRVTAGPVHHGDHAALGYRVEETATGRVCAFTGDSGPGHRLDELVDGADLLVAECGDGLVTGRGRHLDVKSLAELVEGARIGRVAVTHIDPRHGRVAVLARLRELLGDRLLEGEDGLRIAV
jgi:ribonuclease BN (tRNA processing enzyme)